MRSTVRQHWILLTILAIGFVLRLAAAAYVQRRVDAAGLPGKVCLIDGDADGYWLLAQKIVSGQEYSIYEPPRYVLRMPGVPVLLALGIKLFGERLFAIRILLAVVGTAGCGFIYLLGAELFDRRVGLWGAGLVAISPPMVLFSVLILSEIPFATALAGSLWLLARLARSNTRLEWNGTALRELKVASPATADTESCCFVASCTWGMNLLRLENGFALAFVSGVVAGVGTLVRPTWLLMAPAFLLPFLLFARSRSRAIGQCVVLLAGLALTLTPWTWRNYQITGHAIPTTLWVGASLYDGLHPGATGKSDMKFVESEGIYATQSEYDADQHYRHAAWKYLRENPGRAFQLGLIKLGRFWSPWPNAEQFGHWAVGIALAGTFLPACFFAGIGIWCMRRHVWGWLIPCAPLLYFSAVHTLFVGSIRYRLPAEGPLLLLSAVGLLACRGVLRSQSLPPV